MKTLKPTLILLIVFAFSNPVQAQFWKKLGDKVEKAAERVIVRKVEEKTEEKTGNAMDSILNQDKKLSKKEQRRRNKQKNKTNPSNQEDVNTSNQESKNKNPFTSQKKIDLPKSYYFNWKYALKIESNHKKAKNADMRMVYHINENETYLGMKMEMGETSPMTNAFMILNGSVMINLMEMNGEKIITTMNLPNQEEALNQTPEYTMVKTDTKTILGYHCQGFKVVSEEGIANIYVAQNAPFSFNGFKANSKHVPKGFDPKWLSEFKKPLLMEMDFVSNKKEKHNMTMTCVEIKKETLSINTSEYKSMGF